MRRLCIFAACGSPDDPNVPGLGDLITKNVVLEMLVSEYPQASITVVADARLLARFRAWLLAHAHVDELIECPEPETASLRQWVTFLRAMRRRRFDVCVIDAGSRFLRGFQAYLCGIPVRVGLPADDREVPFLTRRVVLQPFNGRHADLLDFARGYGEALDVRLPITPERLTPRLRFEPEAIIAPEPGRPAVVIHAGGKQNWNRRWPLDRYAEICRRLCADYGAIVYLVGGAEDRPESARLLADVKRRWPAAPVHDVCGGTINTMVNYLDAAWLFVGNDSAPMHMAAALGRRVVVVCGPTAPDSWERMYPGAAVSRRYACQGGSPFVARRDLEQRYSCAEHACPYAYDAERPAYPRCLIDVSVDAVWAAVVAQFQLVAPSARA